MPEYLSVALRNYQSNYSGLSRHCWEAILLTFIQSTAIGVCYFISLYFVDTLHFKMATAGLLMSCYGAGTVAGGILSGKLCDKLPPRIISLTSLLAQSFSFLLLLKFKISTLLMINLFILGFSVYGFKTSNDIWMLKQCSGDAETRTKALNISRVAMNLGLGLSGVIIGFYSDNSFENVFIVFSLLLQFCSAYLLYSLLYKKKPANMKRERTPTTTQTIHDESLNSGTHTKVIIVIFLSLFLVGLLIAQLSSTYPMYVKHAFPELGTKAVSILYILDTVLIVTFQAPLINFFNKYNKILLAGIGAFLMGFGMLVLSYATVFSIALLSCTIWTTGEMFFIPLSQLICYEKSALGKKGHYMGLYQSIYASSAVIGPSLGGIIYQYFSPNDVWYFSALVGVICLLLCYSVKKYA